MSTISEDNEQISSERNTTFGGNDDFKRLIASDYGSDYKSEIKEMTTLLSGLDSHLVNSMTTIKSEEMSIDSIKLNKHLESDV